MSDPVDAIKWALAQHDVDLSHCTSLISLPKATKIELSEEVKAQLISLPNFATKETVFVSNRSMNKAKEK